MKSKKIFTVLGKILFYKRQISMRAITFNEKEKVKIDENKCTKRIRRKMFIYIFFKYGGCTG